MGSGNIGSPFRRLTRPTLGRRSFEGLVNRLGAFGAVIDQGAHGVKLLGVPH